jgi:hypothetical protein
VKEDMKTDRKSATLAAGDRVRLLEDHSGLKKGMVGTITHHRTIKRESAISPDASGESMFVVFDHVIGTLTIPTKLLERVSD